MNSIAPININNSSLHNKNIDKQKNVSFKGAGLLTTGLVYVNQYEVLSAMLLDITSMCTPRTIIDMTRNFYAGLETMRREFTGVTLHASIGIMGMLTAGALALSLKSKNYDVDFKQVHADHDTIEVLSESFAKVCKANPNKSKEELARIFLNHVFEKVEGLDGNFKNKKAEDKTLWHLMGKESKSSIIEDLLEQLKTGDKKDFKLNSKAFNKIYSKFHWNLSSSQEIKATIDGKTLSTNAGALINDTFSLTKSFLKDNILDSFKNVDLAKNVPFIKDLKRLGVQKTIIGLSIMAGIGASVQMINRYITKKQTGITGFVGTPGSINQKDKTGKPETTDKNQSKKEIKKSKSKLDIAKTLVAGAMGLFIVKSIGGKNPKEFLKRIMFKSSLPTLNQLKVIYGCTIIGRILASRDKNELRETSTRDFLGFTNWLILGGLVTKLYINSKDKSLINYDPSDSAHGKGLWNWLTKSTYKSQAEILHSHFKEHMIKPDGKLYTVKELYNNNWIKPGSEIAEKLKIRNKGQLLGLAYSALVLGVGIPLLNKYITERKAKNAKKEAEKQQAKTIEAAPKTQNVTFTVKAEDTKIFSQFAAH